MLRLGGMCRYVDMLFCFLGFGLIWFNCYPSLALLLSNILRIVLISI